jgi:hypothetical protein
VILWLSKRLENLWMHVRLKCGAIWSVCMALGCRTDGPPSIKHFARGSRASALDHSPDLAPRQSESYPPPGISGFLISVPVPPCQ